MIVSCLLCGIRVSCRLAGLLGGVVYLPGAGRECSHCHTADTCTLCCAGPGRVCAAVLQAPWSMW